MSNKKKIVIVISIISIMILCLSISSYAIYYPNGMELHDGDIIQLKNNLTNMYNDSDVVNNITFKTKFDNRTYSKIIFQESRILYRSIANDYSYLLYNFSTDSYGGSNTNIPYIIIYGNQTITDEAFIDWLYHNSVSGIPEPPIPPHIESSFWEIVSGFFSEALTSGTAIVNWMTNTPIALIPLALYCLIVIIAITKRMIKG